MNTLQKMEQETLRQHEAKFEQAITQGLELAGYKFDTREELMAFLPDHVECDDFIGVKKKLYKVDGKPFMQEDYAVKIEELKDQQGSLTTRATFGAYTFPKPE